MECETNFYHYTLQVKKGSWECVIYAGFDFYVASTGSSIIAPLGALVRWAPDEMLSWHHYQSPRACPSPVPGVQEGACVVAAGLPPLPAPSASAHASMTVMPAVAAIRHLNGALRACVFVSGAFIPARPLWGPFFLRHPCF